MMTNQKYSPHLVSQITRTLTLFALLMYLPNLGLTEIYKHTDEHGNVVFSDNPHKESTKVELKALPVLNFPPPSPANTTEADPKANAEHSHYEVFEISSPAQDATLRNNNGTFNVSLTMEPALKKSHTLKLWVNGSPSGAIATGTTFRLEQIDRGTHTLQAKVFDQENKLIQSTTLITVHLHRFSKLH